MKFERILIVTSFLASFAAGCSKESAAGTKGAAANEATGADDAAKCKEGDLQHKELGFCVTAPGAAANAVLTAGETRSTTLQKPNEPGVDVKRFKGTLENETIGLDNVSKFQGNKELERGKLPGEKGIFVIAEEDACQCVRITSVLPVGDEVLTCMATADRGAARPHFDACKTLRAL